MKIILDIPDSVIPIEVRQHINQSKMREVETRAMMKALLELFLSEIDKCEIHQNQYRIVMK